jgi:sporulation protein YlmC with PRC-barrel domain
MKTLFSVSGMLAIFALAMSAFAQTQSTTSSNTSYIQTSKFIGRPVKSAQGDQIGTVKDIVLDRNTGCLAYTVLSTTGGGGGTRVSGGGKMVAVPWTVYSPAADTNVLTVTVDRDRIYNAPVFDYARVEEYSRPDYINNVYSYYGVTGGAGVGVGVSGGTSTTTTGATTTTGPTTTSGAATGTNTTAGAAASPAAGASVAGSAAPNTTEGRRAHPGAAAAAGAAAARARETATPSLSERAGERTPSAKQKQQQRTPSNRSDAERTETETRSDTERAPSEGATTGEKTKGSTRERSRSREAKTPSERPQE